ncbi:outer membrane beta-barrel protein [Haloferula chungangensis]|uniref:Outer membrane beta-barrel protein n=1 Tax=Haloferula chungangensis TaxID=1048331 RepID=A0ABW2LD96_9BACT
MLLPISSTQLASVTSYFAFKRRRTTVVKALVRLLAVIAVSPAMVLGPCYGEAMISLPTGISASISDSLFPTIGEAEAESPWGFAAQKKAWQPPGNPARSQTLFEAWEAGSTQQIHARTTPMLPIPVKTGIANVAGESIALPPDDGAWAPADGVGAPAAAASELPLQQGPINPVLAAQTVGECTVMGEISDKTTLDPIIGAIVTIGGTGREAETDRQGRFRVDGLPSGDYLVEVLKLGYSMGSAPASPRPGRPAEIRIALTVKPSDSGDGEFVLAEEVVVGEYSETAQADFEMSIELGQNLVSGLDKSEFTASGISDAAGAVSKIAGANIVGGRYAVVRGLGDRYSNTLVNGALISSADPSKKAVQLDLFPSDLLQSINIFKTFTPNLPGEFAGGLVAIETLSFPEEQILEFEYGIDYNNNLDSDEFWAVPGRDLGMFGKPDDGLPAGITPLEAGGLARGSTSTRPPTASNAAANAAIEEWSALHSSAGMTPTLRSPELGQDLNILYGQTFDFENGIEVGVVASGVWNVGDDVTENVQVGRSFSPGPDQIAGTADDSLLRSQTEDRYESYAGYGLLGSVGVRIKDRHEVSYTFFQNHRGEDHVTRGSDVVIVGEGRTGHIGADDTGFGAGAYVTEAFDSIDPLQRTLTLNQLTGSHKIGDFENPIELGWAFSRSDADEIRPQSRTLFSQELDFTDPRIETELNEPYDPSLGVVRTAGDVYGSNPPLVVSYRENLETHEEAGNERLDLVFPMWSNNSGDFFELSAGGSHFNRSRQVRGRLFTYRIPSNLNDRLIDDDSGEFGVDYLDSFDSLTDPNGDPKFDGWSNIGRAGNLILTEESTSGRTVRNVDAETDLMASYIMGTAKLDRWDFTGGFRYEGESRGYSVLPGLNPGFAVGSPPPEKNSYLLPGILINRSFGQDDEFGVTLGWSKTVARPTFYEFAPTITQDQATGDIIEGNPDLKDTQIYNYDLTVGWRPTPGTSVGISLFHKDMTDPIAQAYNLTRKTWVNGEEGTLQGVELEISKDFLTWWSLTTNFTYIDSSLVYQQALGGASRTIHTTFEGQPEHIFNLNLGYDNVETGWAVNLIYNFTGSYLTGVPLSDIDPPIRRESFDLLDLVVRKRFDIWNGVGIVKLKCGNLLDSTDTQVFDGTDKIYESYKPGRSYSISFKYEF